jgi:hypothetical protein
MNSTTSPPLGRARVVVAILASAAVAAASPGVVQAAKTDEPFGQHVSECAHMSLGKRATPPAVTCLHDGHVHVFANFGEMVQHMREHHGGR